MSTELLERASVALGPLAREVVFVGGATIGLWATDPAAPPARPTRDVDVIVEIAGLGQYSALGERLRARAFREDVESGIICRWRRGDDLILDVMPTDEAILGFSNSWFAPAFESAIDVTLPSGAVIRVVRPPYLVATKIEAFRRRGTVTMWRVSTSRTSCDSSIRGKSLWARSRAAIPLSQRSFERLSGQCRLSRCSRLE